MERDGRTGRVGRHDESPTTATVLGFLSRNSIGSARRFTARCPCWAFAWGPNSWPKPWGPPSIAIRGRKSAGARSSCCPPRGKTASFATAPRGRPSFSGTTTPSICRPARSSWRNRGVPPSGLSLRRAAYGLQFHVEMAPDLLELWLRNLYPGQATCSNGGSRSRSHSRGGDREFSGLKLLQSLPAGAVRRIVQGKGRLEAGDRCMQLKLRTIDLPLRHVFRTAHGASLVQENVLVELRDGDLAGYGEGASSPYYGVTAAGMVADLEAARGAIESWTLADPAELWQRALPLLGANRFALAALDAAAHDLWGKKAGPADLSGLGSGTGPHPAQRLHAGDRHRREHAQDPAGVRRLADLQDQAWHARRLGDRPRVAAAYGGRFPRRRQLFLDRRADDRQFAGVEGAGRGAHRTAAAGRRLGGDEAGLRRIGPAGDGR